MTTFNQQLPDIDPAETQEWFDSLKSVTLDRGRDRARSLLRLLIEQARALDLGVPELVQTPYINTIPPDREPPFPGDEAMEKRIRRIDRWNAAVMVTRANMMILRWKRFQWNITRKALPIESPVPAGYPWFIPGIRIIQII